MTQLVVLDAPSNLGLRPPAPGVAPGVYKLAGALRDTRLLQRLGARDAGVVTPPRYHPDWSPGSGVRNAAAIGRYSIRLADRMSDLLDADEFPIVLGGDCSILLGNLLALRRRGRYGLLFLDGHTDFRHPGNSDAVGAAAGEDLALVTGHGDELAHLEGRCPLVDAAATVVIGARPHPTVAELRDLGALVITAPDVVDLGAGEAAAYALTRLRTLALDGFWIHLDVDVLDAAVMPAVDTPEGGGIGWAELAELLRTLTSAPDAVGLEVTIFDPDLDESGELALRLARCLEEGIRPPDEGAA